jgi:hypothetical protein
VIRRLSYSEVSTALTCQARHDFAYVGQLAGDALKPRTVSVPMREGRAWGHAVAAYHSEVLRTDGLAIGHMELDKALDEDVDEQRSAGVYLPDEHQAMAAKLHAILDHYAATTDPLPTDRPEHEFDVALPSRGGSRRSNRYRLTAYIDGIHTDDEGREWLVEYKLRKQLTPFAQIALWPQLRFYAWAAREALGVNPVGVIVDECLNEAPGEPAINADGRPSKRQSCTLDAYLAACRESKHQPHDDVVEKLTAKRWHQRHPIIFGPGEFEETERQLVSAARLIQQLDTGELFPIRNPSRAHCPGCAYRDICAVPTDRDLTDALFERVPPKRDRESTDAASATEPQEVAV